MYEYPGGWKREIENHLFTRIKCSIDDALSGALVPPRIVLKPIVDFAG